MEISTKCHKVVYNNLKKGHIWTAPIQKNNILNSFFFKKLYVQQGTIQLIKFMFILQVLLGVWPRLFGFVATWFRSSWNRAKPHCYKWLVDCKWPILSAFRQSICQEKQITCYKLPNFNLSCFSGSFLCFSYVHGLLTCDIKQIYCLYFLCCWSLLEMNRKKTIRWLLQKSLLVGTDLTCCGAAFILKELVRKSLLLPL